MGWRLPTWPLPLGFLLVGSSFVPGQFQMWWVLSGGIREGTGLTHLEITGDEGGYGSGWRSHPAWGPPGGKGHWRVRRRGIPDLGEPHGEEGRSGSAGALRRMDFRPWGQSRQHHVHSQEKSPAVTLRAASFQSLPEGAGLLPAATVTPLFHLNNNRNIH